MIEYGYCECGCGGKTTISKQSDKSRNYTKGEPVKFIAGHNMKNGRYKEEAHFGWKGDKVGHSALHNWIKKHYGTLKKCSNCGTTDPSKRYEWANISGEYRRDIKDFKRLCTKCHHAFDYKAYPIGEKHYCSKLTEKEVLEIRKLYVPYKYSTYRLAKKFNIGRSSIRRIIKRKTWKHI